MGGKSDGQKTSSTETSPWAGQQPYLQQQFAQAQNLYNSGQLAPQYYPGQTVATPSAQTQQAVTDLTNTANSAQEQNLTNANTNQITDTLNGKYLDPSSNPYFKGALNNVADAYARGTAAQTDAAFNNAGSYGGSAYTETKAANNQAFANSLNDLANTQYQQGRTNQLQASALAPQTSSLPYSNIAQLANAGSTVDQQNQNLINADMQKYNYNAQLPYNSLANYIGLTGGNYGSNQTNTAYPTGSSLGSALGGAVSGAAAGSMFGPWGTAIGGGLGLASGLFR